LPATAPAAQRLDGPSALTAATGAALRRRSDESGRVSAVDTFPRVPDLRLSGRDLSWPALSLADVVVCWRLCGTS